MKHFRLPVLSAAILLLFAAHAARAQSICFWTDDPNAVPVRIYVDQEYIGDVTAAFSQQPLLDTEGTLSVDTTPTRHELTAVDQYGRVYKGWSGHITPKQGEILYLRIRGGRFREVDRADYNFVFLDWAPLLLYTRPHHHVHIPDLSPLEDNGPLIGMAVAAVGASAALGVATAKNWDTPDSRFPYFAIGLGTEYFPILKDWRNVVQMKARFGGLGGLSLLADAGVSYFPYADSPYHMDWLAYDRSNPRGTSFFTWSIGAGLDYGGFNFSVRYKPATSDLTDTFLVGRVAYDWWITQSFGLDFHAGFGVGGYGRQGLWNYYDFPFGVGFLVRL